MKLIVGLGNPGSKYEGTRHNVGFRIVELLAARFDVPLSSNKFQGEYGQGTIEGQKVALLKPQTYMNLSGDSVAPAARFYKVEPEDLIVIHDELDLPFGRLQLKRGGGTGGHNGLNSIVDRLGSNDFVRLRFGIDSREPMTLDQIGDTLGVTRERIRQLEKKSLEALRASESIGALREYLG